MRGLTLGQKLAIASALVVSVALLLCGVAAGIFIHEEQIEALDGQLQDEALIFLGELALQPGGLDWTQAQNVKRLLPLTHTERYVQIDDSSGRNLYRSANMGAHSLPRASVNQTTIDIAGDAVRLCVFPAKGLILYLAADLDEIDDDTREIALGFLVGSPLLLGTVLAGGWWLARKALRPVQAIAQAAEKISAHNLSHRLPIASEHDEIGRLSLVLNAMLDRLDKSFAQAMRFSTDASHELKTPLTLLRMGTEVLLESPTLSPHDQRAVAALLEQTRQLTSITDSLLLLARADAGHLRLDLLETDVGELLEACASDAAIMADPLSIEILSDVPRPCTAFVDAGRLTQILLNLLQNAIKYNRPGGQVRIAVFSQTHTLRIEIANTGPGIPAHHVGQLFSRFFRAGASSEIPGSGLGLSLARELVRAHPRGELTLEGSDAHWTTFAIRLQTGAATGGHQANPADLALSVPPWTG